jgi:hypothetical protein
MNTALIFKEQAKVNEIGLREKVLTQPHYSIQHIEGYDLLCYKYNIQDLHIHNPTLYIAHHLIGICYINVSFRLKICGSYLSSRLDC